MKWKPNSLLRVVLFQKNPGGRILMVLRPELLLKPASVLVFSSIVRPGRWRDWNIDGNTPSAHRTSLFWHVGVFSGVGVAVWTSQKLQDHVMNDKQHRALGVLLPARATSTACICICRELPSSLACLCLFFPCHGCTELQKRTQAGRQGEVQRKGGKHKGSLNWYGSRGGICFLRAISEILFVKNPARHGGSQVQDQPGQQSKTLSLRKTWK